jgi:hypothetical protein
MFLVGFILGGLAGIIIEALLVAGGRDEWNKKIWIKSKR